MHTKQIGGNRIHHNVDFSGNLVITNGTGHIEITPKELAEILDVVNREKAKKVLEETVDTLATEVKGFLNELFSGKKNG